MATKEELQTQADAEIEAAKHLYAQVNKERREFTDVEYAQAKTDLGNRKREAEKVGYIQGRKEGKGSGHDKLEMQ